MRLVEKKYQIQYLGIHRKLESISGIVASDGLYNEVS